LIVECDHTPYTFIPPKRLDDTPSSFMHRLIEKLHPVCQRRRCILANKVLEKGIGVTLSIIGGMAQGKRTYIAITSPAHSYSAHLIPPRAG